MATCAGCGRDAAVRVNGRVHEHRISPGWLCPGSGRLPVLERVREPAIDDAPAPRISEQLLFQGYSGLVDRRLAPPIPTVETVRSRLAAAVDEDAAARPTSREEVRP